MSDLPHIPTLKEQFIKMLVDHVTISVEDLQPSELAIINKAFTMFESKLEDLKIANDEINRLSIELANTKAMWSADDAKKLYKQNGVCPICKRADEDIY